MMGVETALLLLLATAPIFVTSECPPTPTCEKLDWGVRKPYPPDCSKYIYCDVDEVAVLMDCPVGEFFSPTNFICMTAELSECVNCAGGGSTTTIGTPASTLPDCPRDPVCRWFQAGAEKPYPPDCTKYIYCDIFGREIIKKCPAGQHFSPTTDKCTTPELANCPLCDPGTMPSPTPTPVCPPALYCEDQLAGARLPYPENCQLYIYCNSTSVWDLRTCSQSPSPQHFSPTEFECMSPDDAYCPFCLPSDR